MRAFLFLLLLGSCAAPAAPAAPPARTYAWIWLLTGPQDAALQGEARAAAFAGHFANMQRLADEHLLLLAGPLGPPLSQPDHRGVFVLDVPELDAAQAVAGSDPSVQAGVFVMQAERFSTDAPLAEVPGWHEAFLAAAGEQERPMGFHCRRYVLLTGSPAAAAESALTQRPLPELMRGRFTDRDTALFCLDLTDAAPAQELAAALAGQGVTWTVIPWFATEEVARLASPHGL